MNPSKPQIAELIQRLQRASNGAVANADIVSTEHSRQYQMGMAYAYDQAANMVEAVLLREEAPRTECSISVTNSRTCKRGTRGCVVKHD